MNPIHTSSADIVGAERICGSDIFFSPQGSSAGIFLPSSGGAINANCHFRQRSSRVFFCRGMLEESSDVKLHYSLEEDAHIQIVLGVTAMSTCSLQISAALAKNASLSVALLHFCQSNSTIDLEVQMNGEESTSEVATAFFGTGDSQAKVSVKTIGNAPKTSGNIHMRSALFDNAHLFQKGVPTIAQGSFGSSSHLDQLGALFSSSARLRSLPALDIRCDDVSASHKAHLLQLSDEDQFFLASRGISQTSAKNLLLKGLAEPILHNISDEPLRQECRTHLNNFLEKRHVAV